MRLGERQILYIVKKVDFGVYLAEDPGDTENRVLLPGRQVPEGAAIGDPLEVFIYKDSKDRLIATTNVPKLVMGEVAELTVAQTGRIGAFLDWGLEKDLLLPFREQVKKVKEGDKVLVSLYVDKSQRLCATMNVYHNLRSDSPYHVQDQVIGRAYASSEEFGVFVAVDNLYSALIPKKELYGRVDLGEDVRARVTRVQPDGRLVLSIREKSYLQIHKDAERVLELLDSYEGVLPFNDRVSPAIILRETGMSKNEFKRAVGHLLKAGKIEITEKVIRKK